MIVYMKKNQQGFTLVELIVTLLVLAILVGVAIPSFRHMSAANNLTTTANSIVTALNTARMEAIKRSAEVQFCSNDSGLNDNDTLGTACGTDTASVYVLTRDNAGNISAEKLLQGVAIADSGLQLAANVTPVRYDAMGLAHQVGSSKPYTGVIADICSDDIDGNNHRKIMMTTGAILKVTESHGACP